MIFGKELLDFCKEAYIALGSDQVGKVDSKKIGGSIFIMTKDKAVDDYLVLRETTKNNENGVTIQFPREVLEEFTSFKTR